MNDYVDKLWNSDAVACLDALKEADEAVETINKDMFSIVAGVAADIMQENGNPSDVLKDTLKEFEKRYKGERSLKHMPGSYRSAKSTIVSAVKHGINLFDPIDGKLKGKSALEKEINQATKKQPRDSRPKPKLQDEDCTVDVFVEQAWRSLSSTVPSKLGEAKDASEVGRQLDRIKQLVSEIEDLYL